MRRRDVDVKGVAKDEVARIVDLVSDQLYDGNIVVRSSRNRHNSRGLRSSFTIKAVSSYGLGARTTPSGRHQPVACWHAHWHVLDRLFRAHPDAVVRTMLATYRASTFHFLAAKTAFINAGSALAPARLSQLCDCNDSEWENPTPIPLTPGIPDHPDRAHLESLARLDFHVAVPPAKRAETLEDRMAREIADAEATMAWPVNAYSWSASTPHPYEEGLRDGAAT